MHSRTGNLEDNKYTALQDGILPRALTAQLFRDLLEQVRKTSLEKSLRVAGAGMRRRMWRMTSFS